MINKQECEDRKDELHERFRRSSGLTDETIDKYRNYVNPGIAAILSFSGFDVPEERAEGCYIWDVSGRKFLDCVGGYGAFSLGHLHPKVVEAVKKQLEKEALKSHFFMSTELADACELLASVLPGEINYSFLCNSGTEAVEGALKAARIHTGRPEFIGAINGFHGKSFGSLSVSGSEVYKTRFQPLLPETKHVPFGDADALADAISDRTAAVILEVVQGEGGVIVAPDDYFPKVREICDAQRLAADLRRSPHRLWPHRQDVRVASTTASCRTSSRWRRRWAAA